MHQIKRKRITPLIVADNGAAVGVVPPSFVTLVSMHTVPTCYDLFSQVVYSNQFLKIS